MIQEYDEYIKFVEKREEKLAEYATKSFDATLLDGTTVEERYKEVFKQQDPITIKRNKYRTPFQYDRDRILHSNYFLRLAQKTQLITPADTGILEDRLKHTLRVSQIARSIAIGLNLNEDLVEAISLGHDVGHTPFSHVGEYALNDWIEEKLESFGKLRSGQTTLYGEIEPILLRVPEEKRESFREYFTFGNDKNEEFFMHGRNSFRCLAFKKKSTRVYTNFTREVLFGIWRHSTKSFETDKNFQFVRELPNGKTAELSHKNLTLEAQVVRYADDIAWIVTDIMEGIRIGILDYNKITDYVEERVEPSAPLREFLYNIGKENIGPIYTYFISSIIEYNRDRLDNRYDWLRLPEEQEKAFYALKEYVGEHMRNPSSTVIRGDKIKYHQVKALCDWYYENPDKLLEDVERLQKRPAFPYKDKWDIETIKKDEIARIALISDFISTLTDGEAEELSSHFPMKA